MITQKRTGARERQQYVIAARRSLRGARDMPYPTSRDAIVRLGERMDKIHETQAERMDRLVARIFDSFDRLEAKLDIKIDALDRHTTAEITEARRDLGELRDIVHSQGLRIDQMETNRAGALAKAVEGAAKGAGAAASEAAAATAVVTATSFAKGFWATRWGKAVAIFSGVAALGAGIDNIPKVLKWIAGFFHWAMTSGAK